jgi:thiamine kinase-like enzyme
VADEVVQIVQQLIPDLGEQEGDALPLEGGITNRNYSVILGARRYVIRVPGKDTDLLGIDRQAEKEANEHAAAAGVAPTVVAMLEDPQCIVTVFIDGRGMVPEELRSVDNLVEVARSLRAIHESGVTLPIEFDSFRVVERYAETAAGRGVELPAAYERAHEYAGRIEAVLTGPEHDPVPCHNDLLAANFLHDGKQLWIFDWEYAGMGDRYFDLGNFSVNNELDEAGQADLLEAYFGEPPDPRRQATLNVMRFMSDFREAMWGVVQSGVSDLDFDFTGYATKHFDRMLATAADPKFESWLEEARGEEG